MAKLCLVVPQKSRPRRSNKRRTISTALPSNALNSPIDCLVLDLTTLLRLRPGWLHIFQNLVRRALADERRRRAEEGEYA